MKREAVLLLVGFTIGMLLAFLVSDMAIRDRFKEAFAQRRLCACPAEANPDPAHFIGKDQYTVSALPACSDGDYQRITSAFQVTDSRSAVIGSELIGGGNHAVQAVCGPFGWVTR
jgi:hypothetical protein